jgi:pimeloyl-ACP methyl ester carboxylesterase
MNEILLSQMRARIGNPVLLAEAEQILERFSRGEHIPAEEMAPPFRALFNPAVQNFLLDTFKIDPAELIAGLNIPILIVQGDRDIQVSLEDAERLHEAQPKSELLVFPAVNHVLKRVDSDDVQANAATYADPDLPLAEGVVEAIAQFIASH